MNENYSGIIEYKAKIALKISDYSRDSLFNAVNVFKGFVFKYEINGINRESMATCKVRKSRDRYIAYITFDVIATYPEVSIWNNPADVCEDLKLYIGMMYDAALIAFPKMNYGCAYARITVDEYVDEDYYFDDPCQGLFSEKDLYGNMTLQMAYDWLLNLKNTYTKSAYNAFSYIQNRDYCEKLIYSVKGLECIYIPGERNGKKPKLKDYISKLWPSISADNIGIMYDKRSETAHGDYEVGNIHDSDYCEPKEMQKWSVFSIEVLINTFRFLILHGKDEIRELYCG